MFTLRSSLVGLVDFAPLTLNSLTIPLNQIKINYRMPIFYNLVLVAYALEGYRIEARGDERYTLISIYIFYHYKRESLSNSI